MIPCCCGGIALADIIALQKPEPMWWVCACGCTTFHALSDGTGECAGCGKSHDFEGSGWIKADDDRLSTAKETFRDIQGTGDREFARRRITDMASGDDVVTVAVVRKDGQIHTWSDAETKEQVDWIAKRLGDAAALIQKRFDE
jgi:hypothetical protein